MEQRKRYPTIAACGLDCGLCPRYYTDGPSRCPGCAGPGFAAKHPSCSFITCCVGKRGLEVCGQCSEFPCAKFKSEEEYRTLPEASSYPPCQNILPNLQFVRENGLARFVRIQNSRIAILETMLRQYDDGRSKSFFCRATALLSPRTLQKALHGANATGTTDVCEKARMLRGMLTDAALREGVDLKPRK